MVLKNFDLELKGGELVTANVNFYIEAANPDEAFGVIEEISLVGGAYLEESDITEASLYELQYEIDALANENAHDYWYENKAADAYDSWKDSRYDD